MSLITKPTKLELEGVGTLTLRPSDYVTKGGEGAIYKNGNRILKLSLSPDKLATSGMPEKIKLLKSRLKHPSIVVPLGMIFNSKREPIGYHLPFIDGEAYPRMFTNDWRNQYGFTDASVTKLSATMHEVLTHTHQAGALMVDANELNWLADIKDVLRPIPYVIDVDSWQIGKYAATAIMPSIRDWHGPISENSDWFAWGIVTFLLYTGIHPYKGKLDSYKPGELERRMKDNASVFHKGVRLNHAVRDFSVIPGPLLDWYRETFEAGLRTLPPSPLQTGKAQTTLLKTLRVALNATGGLIYSELLRIPGEKIISVWPCGVVRTDSGKIIEVSSKRVLANLTGNKVAVVAQKDGYLIAEETSTSWRWLYVGRGNEVQELSLQIPVRFVVRSGERLFVVTETELVELKLQAFTRSVLTTGTRWQVLGNSTRWFSGVGVSDVLGAQHLVIPYGEDSVALVRTRELDGFRVVNAVGQGRVVMVTVLDSSGQYSIFLFAGSGDWRTYSVTSRSCEGPELNVAILPRGATAEIREDGELIVAVPIQGGVKQVKDKGLLTSMNLGNIGNQVVYRHDGALWSLRMQ